MSRSFDWLQGTDARWHDKEKTWNFPSGATLTFGYLDAPRDHYRYQGSAFQFIGFDELTQFKENQYLYLHSRLRRLAGSEVPLRMRAASNPGDIGHEWVKARFISLETRPPNCMFIPASLDDNPHLDRDSYIQSLQKLDPITREQLLSGNWDVRPEGGLFKRAWLKPTDAIPRDMQLCRYWDKAATEGGGDWTAGALVGIDQGRVYVLDVKRCQERPAGVEALIHQTAQLDGPEVMIRMEQEPGSAGVDVIDHYARQVLVGYNFKGVKSTGSKVSRAAALSTAAEQGNLWISSGPFAGVLIDEMVLFPTQGAHDDQVDAVAGGYNALALRIGGGESILISGGFGSSQEEK
jgi:predicted phage terminase large subunit-like protein